jgi:hypothetical protein
MILQGDSRKLTAKIREGVDCIATEPDLGPALRQVPTESYAARIIDITRKSARFNITPLSIIFSLYLHF